MNNNGKTMKITAWLLLCCLGSVPTVAQANNAKDKIRKYKILQNSHSDRCEYKYDVVVRVKYKLKSADHRDIVIHGTDPDGNVSELTRSTVDYGKGSVVMTFDAGDCLSAINIDME